MFRKKFEASIYLLSDRYFWPFSIIIMDAHQGIKNTFPSLCLYTLILLSSVLTVICINELKTEIT